MLLHAMNNAVGGSYASTLFDGGDALRLGVFTAILWSTMAIVVMVLRRPTRAPSTVPHHPPFARAHGR
jgi:hypothetical protein